MTCPRCRGRVMLDDGEEVCINCGYRETPALLTPEEMIEQWGPHHLRSVQGKYEPRQGTVHGLKRMA